MFTDVKKTLEETALLSKFCIRSGEPFKKMYYGVNVSAGPEPIDQIAGLLIGKRIQDVRSGSSFTVFIAGKYGILNCEFKEDVLWVARDKERAEEIKKGLYLFLMDYLGMNGGVITTDELWGRKEYWRYVAELVERGIVGMEDRFSISFSQIPAEFLGRIDDDVLADIGDVSAWKIYLPAEIAEARILNEFYGISGKVGPASEEMYDKYMDFMDIVQFTQPVDMDTRKERVKTVVPYIMGQYQPRISFQDDINDVKKRLERAERRTEDEWPVYDSKSYGRVYNPVLQMAIIVVEVGRALGETVVVKGRELSSGAEALIKACTGGIKGWAEDIARMLFEFVIRPVQEEVDGYDKA